MSDVNNTSSTSLHTSFRGISIDVSLSKRGSFRRSAPSSTRANGMPSTRASSGSQLQVVGSPDRRHSMEETGFLLADDDGKDGDADLLRDIPAFEEIETPTGRISVRTPKGVSATFFKYEGGKIGQLQRKMDAAVARKDFLEAHRIQNEIQSLLGKGTSNPLSLGNSIYQGKQGTKESDADSKTSQPKTSQRHDRSISKLLDAHRRVCAVLLGRCVHAAMRRTLTPYLLRWKRSSMKSRSKPERTIGSSRTETLVPIFQGGHLSSEDVHKFIRSLRLRSLEHFSSKYKYSIKYLALQRWARAALCSKIKKDLSHSAMMLLDDVVEKEDQLDSQAWTRQIRQLRLFKVLTTGVRFRAAPERTAKELNVQSPKMGDIMACSISPGGRWVKTFPECRYAPIRGEGGHALLEMLPVSIQSGVSGAYDEGEENSISSVHRESLIDVLRSVIKLSNAKSPSSASDTKSACPPSYPMAMGAFRITFQSIKDASGEAGHESKRPADVIVTDRVLTGVIKIVPEWKRRLGKSWRIAKMTLNIHNISPYSPARRQRSGLVYGARAIRIPESGHLVARYELQDCMVEAEPSNDNGFIVYLPNRSRRLYVECAGSTSPVAPVPPNTPKLSPPTKKARRKSSWWGGKRKVARTKTRRQERRRSQIYRKLEPSALETRSRWITLIGRASVPPERISPVYTLREMLGVIVLHIEDMGRMFQAGQRVAELQVTLRDISESLSVALQYEKPSSEHHWKTLTD